MTLRLPSLRNLKAPSPRLVPALAALLLATACATAPTRPPVSIGSGQPRVDPVTGERLPERAAESPETGPVGAVRSDGGLTPSFMAGREVKRAAVLLPFSHTSTQVRAEAEAMEREAESFYLKAAQRSTDAATRKLLGDLAAAEAGHRGLAGDLEAQHLGGDAKDAEARTSHRQFVLTWVQPGLAGLMDGSVSTLAPIFATAFATQDTWTTFQVGLAASIGAGISMGFTEAASDDGELSGRGSPIKRGMSSGVMTTVGGLGHALPYLITDFWTATVIAIIVVFVELWAIAWIQNRYMETPFFRAALQVVLGGALVLAAGVLIGSG